MNIISIPTNNYLLLFQVKILPSDDSDNRRKQAESPNPLEVENSTDKVIRKRVHDRGEGSEEDNSKQVRDSSLYSLPIRKNEYLVEPTL